ncbi:LysM peptidoglycan-binding domain-containing protein [Anaerocolumna sp. MB42-C2]|uniref:LysM peptidoglycan-binding domain-containing protein n=1 Tax=Anaerocolumna sp. MB42-C2 TaxID=3070997 RepID=UPI0027E0F709|nr:LysM peptidoglycan-binding domain-containing protein [Anaerocolumna sp. MB42-C2]WMJ87227.1 LysM peptidoglycan-binding domain-containing protein [Anaerocolumna sp. MB42-C2]
MNRFRKAAVFAFGLILSVTISSTTVSAADYTILKNDSLYKIGRLFDTPVKTIKSDNNLKTNTLYPGQVIDVNAKTYKVKKGDTLFLIAKKSKVTVASLRRANNKWNDSLKPGKKLVLPAPAKTSKAKKATVKKATVKANKLSTNAKMSTTNSSAVISYTPKELDLLARLITAETTGQPYNAMVGVGAVVINRVQSPDWPDTITKVINHVAGDYYQFTPVKNGYINKPASAIAIKAAKAALNGNDPSKGAMFYFDDTSTNAWLWSKLITARYGIMVFVK